MSENWFRSHNYLLGTDRNRLRGMNKFLKIWVDNLRPIKTSGLQTGSIVEKPHSPNICWGTGAQCFEVKSLTSTTSLQEKSVIWSNNKLFFPLRNSHQKAIYCTASLKKGARTPQHPRSITVNWKVQLVKNIKLQFILKKK